MKYKGYSLSGVLFMLICLLYTKLFFSQARIIRLPFRKRFIGNLHGAINFTTGVDNRIDIFNNANLYIGKNVQTNDYVHIACANEIKIGDNTLIASKVFITDHDHDFSSNMGSPIEWPLKTKPVNIECDCWIGEGVVLLKGIHLGKGCIVGANSVVTKSFDDYSIIVGNPAKLLRKRN